MSYDTDRYNLVKLASQSLAVIECGIQICHPGHAAPKLFYKDYSAHFILEGKGRFIRNGVEQELHAGQGFLIIPNTTCVYIADEKEPWKYVYASFRGADDDALVHNAGLDENNVIFEFPLDEDMIHDIYAMHRAGKKNEARGYDVTGYFLLVMSRLVKAAKNAQGEEKGDYYVKLAKRFIEDHYSEPLTVADIAAHLRIDRTYLYRLFMRGAEVSPSAYLLDVRLNAAAKMLENRELSIREVAANAGFCNVSYFYKRFAEKHGISPKQYREIERER
jgi:AraC-like DNA-binding protein